MKKVKAFFYIFKESFIPNNSYYKKITKTPFLFSLKYFLLLLTFFNFILLIYLLNLFSYNKIRSILSSFTDSFQSFPKELVIIKKGNNLLTTLNRPYFFWIKSKNNQILLFTINETADDSFINKSLSNVILTNQHLIIKSPFNQTLSKIPFSIVKDFYIDKNIVENIVPFFEKLKENLLLIYILVFILLFFLLEAMSFLITTTYLLVSSFFVYLYFKIRHKRHFHYKKILQLSFHAITFILSIEYLFFLIPSPLKLTSQWLISLTPFLFILISSLITGASVWIAYNNHSH